MRLAATLALALMGSIVSTPLLAQGTPDDAVAGTKQFEMKVLAEGFEAPWEITLGPDGWLWITERTGGQAMTMCMFHTRTRTSRWAAFPGWPTPPAPITTCG
jgi:glucose/arabinose dehydrogenase